MGTTRVKKPDCLWGVTLSKLSIKVGALELEYEGPESFSKADILELIEHLGEHSTAIPTPLPINGGGTAGNANGAGGGGLTDLGVESIAARLGAKSGTDVLLAAAVYLEANQGKAFYSRRELLDAAKQGGGYYSDGISSNLTAYLTSLVKGKKLNKRGDDQYALVPSTKTDALSRLV